MSKHTPGPWYAYSPLARGIHAGHAYHVANSKPAGIVQDEDGWWVPDFPDWNADSRIICKTTDDEFSRDNASLIAASPQLLAGCRRALAEIDPEPDGQRVSARCRCCDHHPTKHAPGCLVLELRAAIAKAEGGGA